MDETTVPFRPVGENELELIRRSEFTAFPPRLPEQPIFYPVVTVWPSERFHNMLKNPFYAGTLVVQGWEVDGTGALEPIVTPEKFRLLQSILRGHVATRPRRPSHPDFPLRHFVRCEVVTRRLLLAGPTEEISPMPIIIALRDRVRVPTFRSNYLNLNS